MVPVGQWCSGTETEVILSPGSVTYTWPIATERAQINARRISPEWNCSVCIMSQNPQSEVWVSQTQDRPAWNLSGSLAELLWRKSSLGSRWQQRRHSARDWDRKELRWRRRRRALLKWYTSVAKRSNTLRIKFWTSKRRSFTHTTQEELLNFCQIRQLNPDLI